MLIPVQSAAVPTPERLRVLAGATFAGVYVPKAGLIHQWLFAEASGNVALDSVGRVDGVLMASVTRGPEQSTVHITGGNDSFVAFGTDVGQFGTSDFSVALWIKTSEQLRYYDIVGNRTDGSHGVFFCIRMTGRHESLPTGMLCAEVDQNGTNYVSVQSSRSGLNDGEWHHMAVVRTGGKLTIYVDGKLCGTAQGSAPADIRNGHDFRLGRSLVGVADRFAPDATYRDLRVYGALNDRQVWEIYRAGAEVTGRRSFTAADRTIILDALGPNRRMLRQVRDISRRY